MCMIGCRPERCGGGGRGEMCGQEQKDLGRV